MRLAWTCARRSEWGPRSHARRLPRLRETRVGPPERSGPGSARRRFEASYTCGWISKSAKRTSDSFAGILISP